MRKKYNSQFMPARAKKSTWPLILFFGFLIGLLSYTFNYAQEVGFLAWSDKWVKEREKSTIVVEAVKSISEPVGSTTKVHSPPKKRRSSRINAEQEVNMPFSLTFDGTEGGLSNTGFTMADAYTGTRLAVDGTPSSANIGYEPSRLTLADGKLSILTNKGIGFVANNNQINALGVEVTATGKLTFETTVINPFNGTGSEQGGLWFGLNDKTFLKLVVTGNKIEMRKELNDVSTTGGTELANPDQRITATIAGLNTQTVRLRMVVDLITSKLEGFYSTDGVNYLNAGSRYTTAFINIANMELAGKTAYAGLFATHRNATTPVTFTFDDFSVSRQPMPVVTAPYRINAGGIQRTVGADTYSADEFYAIIPGETSNTNYAMTGVEVPELYYDRRFGVNVGYRIPIADGRYTVKLHMVENFHSAAGNRVFDVALEDETVINDIDLYVAAGNKNKTLILQTFEVDVTDGALNIDFVASKDKAMINAIEILPVAAPVNIAPAFAAASYSFSKDETAEIGAIIGTVSATDADEDAITYSISAGNEAGKFAINPSSGQITLLAALDYDIASSYTLTVKATDDGTPAQEATVQVSIQVNKVVPANTAPVFSSASYSFSKDETAQIGASIGIVSATDADENDIIYTITAGNEANNFAINTSTGEITLAAILDYATTPSYTLTVTATDNGTPVEEATVQVNIQVNEVVPANTAPVFAEASYSFSKDETAEVGSSIGSVSATDADGNAIAYSITSGNEAGKFSINASTGEITVAAALDYNLVSSYSLTITATDNGAPALSATTQVIIQVNEVVPGNTAPKVANSIGNKSAIVGTNFSFMVPANTFADEEGDALTLIASLEDGSALPAWLSLNENTFSGIPTEAASYTIQVTANDGQASVSTNFILTVSASEVACSPISTLPCNQIAISLPFSLTFNGNESGLSNSGFTMADAYSGTRVSTDGVASSEIRGYEPSKLTVNDSKLHILTNKGISIVGNNNQINALGVKFNASTGNFVIETTLINPFRGTNDEQGGLWYGLNDKTFVRLSINNNRVVLRKETNDLSPITSDLNDPSRRNTTSISGLHTQTVRLRMVINPSANKVEGFYSTNGTTYINVGETYPVKTLDISGMGLTGSEVYAGVFGTHRNGPTAVTYSFDNFSILYETTPVNTAPAFAAASYNFSKDETAQIGASIGIVSATDADGNAIVYSITSGNEAGKFAINATTGQITLAAALDYDIASSYSLTVKATDDGIPAKEANVQVNIQVNEVVPVNIAPVFAAASYNFSKDETAQIGAVVGSVSATDADAITYSITAGNAGGKFAINASTGEITVAAALDYNLVSSYSLTITATDNGAPALSATAQVTIQINNVNANPVVVSAPEAQTLTASQAFSFQTGSFSDPDAGDILTYTASLADNSALPSWLLFNAGTQIFSGTAPAQAGNITVRITATDQALSTATATFTLTIEAAQPAEPCSPISTLPCNEVIVSLPYLLNFDGSEGGLSNTGFTMADAYTGTRLPVDGTPSSAVIGYEPSKLTIANGRLSILTNKGIGFTTNNNQINALGVGIMASGKLTFETTVINPFNGASSEQGGLWFGLNDKTFLKLVVTGNRIELRKEINDVSTTTGAELANPDQRITTVITGLNTQTVRLRLIVDLVAGTAEGFYSTDGVTYVSAGSRYSAASITITNMELAGKTAYAGIFATHRNATNAVTFTFDNFSIISDGVANKMLAFTPNTLEYSVLQGGTITSKSTVLSANEGTPVVTLSKNTASWLTLPSANIDNLTFGAGNISSSLAPGTYEAIVTASAEGYSDATLTVKLTVTSPVIAQQIKVNFQDPATIPPTGWVQDYGQPFGSKHGQYQGEGLIYGWKNRSNSTLLDISVGGTTPGNGRNRNSVLNPDIDVLLATLMHLQADDISGTFNGTKAEGYWEIQVPNGEYNVTLTAGDGDVGTVPEIHSLNVEGVSAISLFTPTGTAGSATRFKTATVRVNVTDGLLTINADGGTNTKINSAIITPVNVVPYLLWSASTQSLVIDKGTSETDKTFSLDLSNSGGEDDLVISMAASYSNGASNWLSFNATHLSSEPNVTFDYTAAKDLPLGTYTATITASTQGYTNAITTIQITVITPGSLQPYVVSSTPANGATNVSVNISSIAANNLNVPEVPGFDGGVDNTTLTTATVKLLKVSGNTTTEILGVVQGTGGGDAISFSPVFALEPNTTYKFVVTSQVKAHSGVAFLPYEATFTTGAISTDPGGSTAVEFAPKQVIPGTVGKKYTSLTFGPDGRFYALRLDGVIERFVVNRETGMLSSMVEIRTVLNKDGARSAVGLVFDPASTPTNLIAYLSHCTAGLTNAPEFDGNLSRLTGANLETEQLVLTKLPRSKKDHLVNNIVFGPDGAIYFCQGSNSSMGAYDGNWQRDESLLSGTVLRLDLQKLTGIQLPLDVRTTANLSLINTAPANNIRMSDGTYNPYATNSPLTIFASGVRNAYDLLWHSNGQLYVPTNGSAAGGNSPASVMGTRRPDGSFYNGPVVPATSNIEVQNDWLFRVNPLKSVGFFGHPNPLRGEYVSHRGYVDNRKYASTQQPDANYRGAAFDFELNKSPNGVIEYKSNAFGGALKGRILVCRFSGGSDIIVLEPGSMANLPSINSADDNDAIYDIVNSRTGSGTNGIAGLSGFTNPLDITEDVQTGNLYVIEYNWNNTAGKTAQLVLLKATTPSAPVGIASVSPTKIIDNDVINGAAGKNHTITLANTGNSTLGVTKIELTGSDISQFQLIGVPAASTAAPVLIAPNSAITFNIAFNPTSVGVKTAKLEVSSINNTVKEVVLSGLGTVGLSGANEPSLQAVLNVHGINVNVGDDNNSTNIIHSSTTQQKAALLGEEIAAQKFQRATDGPVIIEPLSVFGPQHSAGTVMGFGWYTSGNANAKNELFTVANSNYQTVDVETNGVLSFDPGIATFGFYSRWPAFDNRHLYSEDALNTFTGAIPHHVRVYPMKNTDGTQIENAYIIATEEHISGFDYQDIVVLVYNIKPVVTKELTFSTPALAFTHTPGLATDPQTVSISANTGTPAVTLTKLAGSDWLILPQGNLGSLTFGINADDLIPGSYTATVTASASEYTSTTLQVNLTVNQPAPFAAISVSNQELVFDGLKNTTITKRLTITNIGNQVLNIGNINITGTNAGSFSVQALTIEGEPAGNALEADETKTIEVSFVPGNAVSTFSGVLNIASNALNSPALTIGLYAMSLNGFEGGNEPPLQQVVNTLGYKINVGWTTLADGTQATMKGEEVAVQLFEKAGEGVVTITPVARYSPNQELPFGFYTKNNNAPVRTVVGTLSGLSGQHQALFPQIVAGSDQFNTGTAAFGIYVLGLQNRLSYTEDPLNAGGPALHAVRTYPLKDRQGVLVPNSYLVCFEDASNGDYQDYVFVIRNVIAAGSRKTLAFNPSTLNFNVAINGTVAPKTVALEASNGTPAVTLTKSANSNWLVLPTAALGNLSFGINATGMSVGVYTATVTTAANGFTSATMTVNMQIADVSANAVKVNFQLSTSTTPAGYVADAGLAYSEARGYGWIDPTTKQPKDHTLSMRDRTTSSLEPRLRTLALMQGTSDGQTPGSWELKVAPGQYNVTIGVGDPNFFDSNHRINVEGVPVISNFIPTAQVPTQVATTTVMVMDGLLTVDATGGTNSKISFIIVDAATADGDFIPPVASLRLKGTLQSAGVYRNQVIVTVNASDAGGSELDKVLYSINNGPFVEYFAPLLINTVGTYSIRAKAIDGNENETTTNPVTFSVMQPALSNANMMVENLDKFPANDRLTFSFIQVPWRRENGDGTFTPYNRNHDQVKVKISNKGTGALTINNLTFSNTTGWKITQVNNVAYDAATTLPITVNPNSSVEVGIQFIATFNSGRIRILNDTLHITSNDDQLPKKPIILHGMWQARGEGGNEPYAQEIIRAFGFKTNTGFNSNDGTNTGNSMLLNTDEILSSFFVRADASKPVYVIQMGAYHGCCSATETFQWYAKGSTSNTTVFTHHPLDGQSLLPMRNGSTTALADGTFNPSGAFGVKASGSYSDRTRNSEGKIGVRVWKAIDPNGNIIPNAYLIGHDYIGSPGVTNYDYQDNVYYISNIKPETGSVNYSELAAAPSAIDFGSKLMGSSTNLTINLKNLGLTYANGSSDPAITIKSVEIMGANLNEFIVNNPASTSVAPQATTTVTVGFRPNSRGIKNAALLVHYNNSLSPVRIPLYGKADDNCNVVTLVKRIKSGADANLTINGKVWESDKTFRQGSVQLDKPAATPIAATEDDVLYQTYLSASTDLAETRYQIPVANDNYMVRLHFVENAFNALGSRVFSINMENQPRLANLDIFKEVGYKAAMVRDFEVAVTDGKLDIRFNPAVNRVAIAGIEIYVASANPNAVTLTQQSVVGSECGATNGSITLAVTNSTAASFLFKIGQNGSYQTTPVFTNLASGSYTFYVKENVTGGCETTKVFTIPDRNNSITFTVNAPVLNCNTITGSATISNITGGSGNYTITWNTNPVQTGATANGLAQGVYIVTVQDASGCSKSQEVTINRQENCEIATLRINAGGPQVTLPSGVIFSADQYFSNTYTYQNQAIAEILNTTDDVLYKSERGSNTDGGSFAYNIPVRNGNHTVILHFAEIYFNATTDIGKRVFNVRMEGQTRLTNYDIVADAGPLTAVTKTFTASVTDGTLNIEFVGKTNRPKVSAIEVITVFDQVNTAPVLAAIGNKSVNVGQALTFTATATDANTTQTKTFSLVNQPQGATINATTGAFSWTPTQSGSFTFTVKVTDNGTPSLSDEEQITVTVNALTASAIRINAGGAIFNASGSRQFIADTYFGGTDRIFSIASGDILNTTDDVMYRSSRSATSFTYSIPVVNGNFNLILHFAEIFHGAPGGGTGGNGSRIFHVDIEGSRRLANYDIFAKAGGAMRAIQETLPVTVSDGTLNISLVSGSADMPTLSAIEVVPAATNSAPVLASIGNKIVNEGVALTFTASATDANTTQTKTFSLVNQPQGATINATTGAFSWTPTEAQGQGSYTLIVRVADNGTPALSDEEQITVTVNEVNQAPVLAVIGNKSVSVNQALTFTATVTDADLPAQTQKFSLVNQPQGATINATTGAFSWTPTQSGSFTFTVKVADNGTPSLSDEEQITVTVNALTANAIRINAGGTTQTVSNTTWAGCITGNCNNYVSGGFAYTQSPLPTITGIPASMNASIFQTEWTGGATGSGVVAVGAVAFTYNIPVTNGNYLVRLHFVELNKNGQNLRVFDVNIEGGTKELVNFDIFKEASGMLKPIVREFAANITDGNVTIQFIRQIENAKISAIEIIPATAANQPPVAVAGANQTVTAGTNGLASLQLNGSGSSDANGSITSYVWREGATQLATGVNPTVNLPVGSHLITLTVTDNQGATATAQVTITVNAPAIACTLPTGWTTKDIGTVGQAGEACFADGNFTVKASGADIWGTADQFRYAYNSLNCDGEIIARVNSLTNTNVWAKAGVMIRETDAAGAKHAMMVITPGNGAAFQYRNKANGSMGQAQTTVAGQVPKWVRIVRAGNIFTGYVSDNGTAWTQVGQTTITMNSNVLIGMALTSHNNGALATAVFTNVSVKNNCTIEPIRINAGGPQVTLSNGTTFRADQYFSNTHTYQNLTIADIANTSDDVLYKTERGSNTNLGSFSYDIPVPNGNYKVRLHFAEIYYSSTANDKGKRIFNVNIEGGATEIVNFDITATVGVRTAVIREFDVTVADQLMNMVFSASVNRPTIAAIEVIPQTNNLSVTNGRASLDVNAAQGSANGKLYLNVYPNPNIGDKVYVELKEFSGEEEVTITLHDLNGRIVQSRKLLTNEYGTLQTELIIEQQLQSGTYLIQATSASGKIAKNLVIQY